MKEQEPIKNPKGEIIEPYSALRKIQEVIRKSNFKHGSEESITLTDEIYTQIATCDALIHGLLWLYDNAGLSDVMSERELHAIQAGFYKLFFLVEAREEGYKQLRGLALHGRVDSE